MLAGIPPGTAIVMDDDSHLRSFIGDRAVLLGYLRTLLPHDLVEDAFQEVFLVVHRKVGEFDQTRDFPAWVRGIARNVAMQVLAKARRAVALPPDALLERIDRAAEEASAEPEPGEDRRHLAECLAKLSDKHRDLLRQRYADGLMLEQLATATGRSVGAVQVALSRLRSTLQDCIERQRKVAT